MKDDGKWLKALFVWCFRLSFFVPALAVAHASIPARLFWIIVSGFWLAFLVVTSHKAKSKADNRASDSPKTEKNKRLLSAALAYLLLASLLPVFLILSAISWNDTNAGENHYIVSFIAHLGGDYLPPIHQMVTKIPPESAD
jgi:hypothetical protein